MRPSPHSSQPASHTPRGAALARLLLRSGSGRRDSLLLLGACGSGKTALFSRLVDGGLFAATVPSMTESVGLAQGGAGGQLRRLRLVDLPGHPRLRTRLDDYAACARGVVFLVDGREGAFLGGVRETAECAPSVCESLCFPDARRAFSRRLLLDVLSHPGFARRAPPLLLLVNKRDKSGCHSADFVARRLERELQALRVARGTLEDAGASGGGGAAGGATLLRPAQEQPFTFAACRWRVTTATASVLRNELAALTDFAGLLK